MTNRRQLLNRLLLSVACVLLMRVSVVRAEVSVDLQSGQLVGILVMGSITEDPDPIGIAAWQVFRPLPQNQILNPSGYLRGDGTPDIARKTNGWPIAVWSYNAGGDHDIAISEWDGEEWGIVEFLTTGTDDDLEPRVFVEDDGTAHVVWWTDGAADRVFLATRHPASSLWELPVEVVTGGRRPSVAVFDGVLRVAYERDSTVPGMAQDVIVVRHEPGDSFIEEFTASTNRGDRLDPVLHALQGQLWLDWKQASEVFGCTEYGVSGWGRSSRLLGPTPRGWASRKCGRRFRGRHSGTSSIEVGRPGAQIVSGSQRQIPSGCLSLNNNGRSYEPSTAPSPR